MKLVVALALMAVACARTQSTGVRPPAAQRRIMDAPPERLADMPAPFPEADPANREDRFGIEQARARREAKPRPTDGCVDVVDGKPTQGNPCPPPPKGK